MDVTLSIVPDPSSVAVIPVSAIWVISPVCMFTDDNLPLRSMAYSVPSAVKSHASHGVLSVAIVERTRLSESKSPNS